MALSLAQRQKAAAARRKKKAAELAARTTKRKDEAERLANPFRTPTELAGMKLDREAVQGPRPETLPAGKYYGKSQAAKRRADR